MSTLTDAQISIYRKHLHEMLKNLNWLAKRCLFTDVIVKGKPHEVYRKCGKPNCKCAKDINHRHGPYHVVTVVEDGRQKQYSLSRNKEDLWKKVVHYQYQLGKLKEFKEQVEKVSNLIEEVIEKRTKEFKK